jgi:hypothetical protein
VHTLVVSVLWDSPRNPGWLAAQAATLDAFTAGRLDRLLLPVGCHPPPPVPGVECLPPVRPSVCPLQTRLRATRAALAAWAERAGRYDGYLLLDSDAFPARRAWDGLVRTLLAPHPPRPARRFAALCRADWLEPWPHPAVLFARRADAVTADDFALGDGFRPGVGPTRAVGAALAASAEWLPLVRTGGDCGDFLHSGIYGGLFYHHNFGSRPATRPAVFHGPWDATPAARKTPHADSRSFDRLTHDPLAFAASLVAEPALPTARTEVRHDPVYGVTGNR